MPVIFLAHGAPYFTGDDGEMVGADVLFSALMEPGLERTVVRARSKRPLLSG